ncbi:Growth/differentiation factor 8, partial [Orchesella cincta]
ICSVCRSHEDISRNLIRDPVELGNPYPAHGAHYEHPVKRKHSSHHHRVPIDQHSVVSNLNGSQEAANGTDTGRERQSEEAKSGPHHHDHNSQMPVNTHESEDCPMCAAARQNAKSTEGLDDETLRAVRVEMIKQQILKKLRLKEPPKMQHRDHHNAMLPPIALGINEVSNNEVRQDDEDTANLDLDDFYGKTEQIIVLPQDVLSSCSTWSHHSRSEAASCFVFNLPKEVRSSQISSAEMWVYKFADMPTEQQPRTVHTHNLSVSEMITMPHNVRSSRRRSNIHFNMIAARDDVPETAEWVKFNITDKATKWLIAEVHEHTIKISCTTCSTDVNEFPFDTTGDQQPFIVFNIAHGKRRRRNRRNINCAPGVNECCRESLYISFKEIKWDWVFYPEGFDAYYCKGSCHGDTALAHTATRHSGIMIDVVKNRGGVNNKTVELVPCCTATKMGPLMMMFVSPQSQNSTQIVYTKKELPNMMDEELPVSSLGMLVATTRSDGDAEWEGCL